MSARGVYFCYKFKMKFNLSEAITILERTPTVCTSLLSGLSNGWTHTNEGPETFSPYDVMGHLIHGEKTDWIPRSKLILEFGTSKTFEPWDRFAQNKNSKQKTLEELLQEFANLRQENLAWLKSANLSDTDLNKTGIHPMLGEVSLQNLLATWVVHDLSHIAQINRVMAKQYKAEIGPWLEFFRILKF